MIRLTRQADYGILLLTSFATSPAGTVQTARELAEESRLPLPMVSKILKLLARAGLLSSHRGVRGGYSLPRRPEQVSVAEIIETLEGPIGMTECSSSAPGNCEHETFCVMRNNWQMISQTVRLALSSLTLADLTRPIGEELLHLTRVAHQGTNGHAGTPNLAPRLETP